jgi:hypothetical protein
MVIPLDSETLPSWNGTSNRSANIRRLLKNIAKAAPYTWIHHCEESVQQKLKRELGLRDLGTHPSSALCISHLQRWRRCVGQHISRFVPALLIPSRGPRMIMYVKQWRKQ